MTYYIKYRLCGFPTVAKDAAIMFQEQLNSIINDTNFLTLGEFKEKIYAALDNSGLPRDALTNDEIEEIYENIF